MHKERKYILLLILRVVLCFITISAFEYILRPLTIYLSYLFLLPFGASLLGNTITISSSNFNFISACIAPAMYYLIWILVLLTKNITVIIRAKMVFLGFFLLLVMNVIRVVALVLISVYLGVGAFEDVHLLWWKFMSGVYVALVWIFLVKYFKIQSIPIYDDLKALLGYAKRK